MSKQKQLSIYEKAQLLKAGQVVEIQGDYFKARRIEADPLTCPCTVCELDSICRMEHCDICSELETRAEHNWILELAHPL